MRETLAETADYMNDDQDDQINEESLPASAEYQQAAPQQ